MSEEAKTKCIVMKRRFTRSANILKAALIERGIPIQTIERRFTDLTCSWNETQKAHDSYIVTLEDIDITQEDKWIDELSDKYCALEIDFDKYVNERSEQN